MKLAATSYPVSLLSSMPDLTPSPVAPHGTRRRGTSDTGIATILIIGASRGVGLEAVRFALEAGHTVRALARSAKRIGINHPNLRKVSADALNQGALAMRSLVWMQLSRRMACVLGRT
jgi:NAD(P)H-binding